LTKLNSKKLSSLFKVIVISLVIHSAQALEESGLICIASTDRLGQETQPKLYYFESNRVQEFVFHEIIKPGAIIASEKNIILKKSGKFRFKTPRPNYLYWQENNETMIYNLKTSSLKVKILDEKVRELDCNQPLAKTEFYAKMIKWKKLYNMRLNIKH